MTDAELDANLAKLREAQRRTHDGIHELLNVLAIIRGEIDLAVERAREKLADFYTAYPEFRD